MRQLRMTALAVALLSLAVIGLRPSWRVGVAAHDAVLLTPGANAASAEGLADSLGGAPVFTTLTEALAHRAGLARLHVIGWGLGAEDWARLESIPVTFHPTALPPGFVRASWPADVVLGDRVTVDGAVAERPALVGRRAPTTRVELVDLSGVVDSSAVDSTGVFHLETAPRAAGHQRYTLQVRGTAIAETLGVEVLPPPAWRVLVLESAPRPETMVLRDWLARRGGRIAVRSAVSRDRVHREFVNRDATSLDVLTGALLAQFDIVVIDGRTLAGLAIGECALLRRAVEADGLGVLLVPDTVVTDGGTRRFADRDFFLDFGLQHAGNIDERLVRPKLPARWGREPPAPAIAAEPYTLTERFGTATLVTDEAGHALAQVAPRGAGRVTLSLISGSARWRRSGLGDTYAAYWSRLLAATAAAERDTPRWSIATPGPWIVGRPVAIEVASPRPISVAHIEGAGGAIDTVFLARDSAASGRWRGIYWPRVAGWFGIAGDGNPAVAVQTQGNWIGVQSGARRAASERAVVGAPSGASATGAGLVVPAHPMPLVWPFALFLLAAGTLWSERRRPRPTAGSPADTAT